MRRNAGPLLVVLLFFVGLSLGGCSQAGFRSTVTNAPQEGESEDGLAKQPSDNAVIIHSEEGKLPAKPSQLIKLSQTFPVSEKREGKMSVPVQNGQLARELTLAASYIDDGRDLLQLTIPTTALSFRQGMTQYTDRNESFDQTSLGVLDLQLVIDNSKSMTPYQDKLAPLLQPLLKSLTNTNWQINVVTTDPADPCSRALIKKGDVNAGTVFANAVRAGINGESVEQPIRTARTGLACTNMWLRPNSSIAVLFVGDEDNCNYNGNGCRGMPWDNYSYLTNFITSNLGRTLGRDARLYGIIRVPSNECTEAPRSPQLEAAITLSGGRYGAICSNDFRPTLEAISSDINTILKQEFLLAQMPSPGTLQVFVNGALRAPATYTLNGQVVRFNDASKPAFGAKINVSYKVAIAAPITSRFALGEIPLSGSVVALVNGALVNPAQYVIDTASAQIVFNPPPPEGAEIRVSFKKNVALTSSFSLDNRIVPASLEVKVNGALVNNYKLSNGILTFTSPPPEAAAIIARYRLRLGPVLSYPLSLSGAVIDFQGLFDKTTGERLNSTYNAGNLIVAADSFVEGRKVIARYRNESSGVREVELPQIPIEGSLKFTTTGGVCNIQNQDFLLMLNCTGADDAKIELTWSYYTPKAKSFKLEGALKPNEGLWKVAINGEETEAYTRDGATITLSEEQDFLDKVTLDFTLTEYNTAP